MGRLMVQGAASRLPRRESGWRRALWGLVILVSAVAESGHAQTNAITHSPAEVVEKYFLLDNKGARLDATSFDVLAPYVAWKEEPLWGKIVVINGFSVPKDYRDWEIVTSLEVVIPVEFTVLGAVYLDSAGFIADPSVERVGVRVKVSNNRWKITDPVLPPHVGQRRMLYFVRQAMQEETQDTKRATLAALQNELRKAK